MKCDFASKHSLISINICKYGWIILVGTVLMMICPEESKSQMFSVGEEGTQFSRFRSELFVGFEPTKVTYEGGNVAPEAERVFAFDGPLLRAGYKTNSLSLFLGSGGTITGIDDVSYFDVGGYIDQGISLYRSPKLKLQIPIRISARYTNMTNSQRVAQQYNQFRLGNLTLGAGLEILTRLNKKIRLEAGAVPGYGFSFASGGFFGGSITSVAAEGKLYFDRVFGNIGISAGYKYDFRNYNVDEDAFDYKMLGHSIQIGITF